MSVRWRWILAVVLTLSAAVWQRMSGPTYPVRGSEDVGGAAVRYRLTRSQGGDADQLVRVHADAAVSGDLAWRRYPTNDAWTVVPMMREGSELVAFLPNQPPAGKLEYQVRLQANGATLVVPERPAITRFKGEVPFWLLHPHILAMFVGMLLANRAGIEALVEGERLRAFVLWTLGLLVVGGLMFGPAVQEAAFGAWWTGVPFGWDLTDNKTLIAVLAWLWPAAVVTLRRGPARAATVFAALVTFAVFMIPHSTWGSELKWDEAAPVHPIDSRKSTVDSSNC